MQMVSSNENTTNKNKEKGIVLNSFQSRNRNYKFLFHVKVLKKKHKYSSSESSGSSFPVDMLGSVCNNHSGYTKTNTAISLIQLVLVWSHHLNLSYFVQILVYQVP